MLLSYQREVQDVGSALKELRENMDSAQAVWELGLDSTRNRIIKMNLYIGMATLSASWCARASLACRTRGLQPFWCRLFSYRKSDLSASVYQVLWHELL